MAHRFDGTMLKLSLQGLGEKPKLIGECSHYSMRSSKIYKRCKSDA